MVDLDRLLSRLQQTILRADAERERRLRNSEYERQKLAFVSANSSSDIKVGETCMLTLASPQNVDYARTLLTRMDQDAFSIKVLTRKQATQDDLKRKRELLDHITDRLKDLEEMGTHPDDDDSGSEGDDILNDIIMSPSESMDSQSMDVPKQGTEESGRGENESAARSPAPTEGVVETLEDFISEKPDVVTPQNLRPRGVQSISPDPEKRFQDLDTAQTTGAATSLLFGNRSKEVSDVSTSEAILDHQRKEQEVVTEDLLRMASQLKLSSQRFGEALQEDTEVLTRAGEGLSKNELSLEAAAKRMSAITRMTEGKGWWGRIMLYAWIYGMMLVLVLLVFVLPKLRF